MSTDIFISYAREDRSRVQPLAQLLQAEGWSVWWDPEIPVGLSFDDVIDKALGAARCVIVVWTQASVESDWVKAEAGEGAARRILAPVLMEEVRVPLRFRQIQAASLVGWEGEREHTGMDRLMAALSRIAGPPKRETPEPEEEDEPPQTVAIAPELEGQGEAIPGQIASEEEASLAESEESSHPEEDEPEIEPVEAKQAGAASIDDEQTISPAPEGHVAPPEEASTSPEKRVPTGLAHWIKEPKRLALVAAVAGLVVIALIVVFAIQNGNSSGDSPPLGVASIEINPSEARIAVDSTVQLTATLKDSLANLLDGPVDWESSDSSIASVTEAGVVTGLKEGSARITAKSEAAEGTARIGVSPAPSQETDPQRVPDIDFVLIRAGNFQMGSTNGADGEQPVHTVRLSSFYMSATEVTQGQWREVMGTEPWKRRQYLQEGDDYPAVYVSWEDAQVFIDSLNVRDGVSRYRLPTEAEWEYAARAGSAAAYSFGDDASELREYAWYEANAWSAGEQYAHQVRQKKPNAFGASVFVL